MNEKINKMNEKIKLKIIGFYQSVHSDKSCFIVMQEDPGNKKIAVQIGLHESDPIIFTLENIKTRKPFIHDLFYNLATVSNVKVKEVLISGFKNGQFDSNISFEYSNHILEIPLRPCDAIALAIRFNVRVQIYREVLDEAAIRINETKELRN